MPVVDTPEKLKQAKDKLKSTGDQRIEDVRFVMSSKQGRRFIWQQLCNAKIFHPCFTGNSLTYYNEGRRESGLALMKDVHLADKNGYLLMHRENADFSSDTPV